MNTGRNDGVLVYKRFGQGPFQLGGETAEYCLPKNYDGPCRVIASSSDLQLAVLPTIDAAIQVACYALMPDGGYGSVYVIPANEDEITHQDFNSWL